MVPIINAVHYPCLPFLLIAFLRYHPKWPRQEHQYSILSLCPMQRLVSCRGSGKHREEALGHLAQQSAEQKGRKSHAVNYRNHCKKEEDNLCIYTTWYKCFCRYDGEHFRKSDLQRHMWNFILNHSYMIHFLNLMALWSCTAIEVFFILEFDTSNCETFYRNKTKTTTKQQTLKKEWETARGEQMKKVNILEDSCVWNLSTPVCWYDAEYIKTSCFLY